ncbi:hypothetical protein CK203_102665 [Vitis vinifera]|uniref:Uncharacterized protein n=1 Tax=Vitis vinifera TaxID=29760 RepID=A0A438C608_VITVI|nr:hypothetical protein CK203_102665 [Vitis vinifera]
MLPQPPIEGNLDCRARPFHSELCFDIAAFRVRPSLPIIPTAEEISHGALADSERLFLPRIATDFYQSMTTNQAAMPNLEHLGYPSEPQLERKRIFREPFTLDKWNNMTAYKVDQPEQPQPAARRASLRHIPEGITVATPAIPRAAPAVPASSQPSTSASRGWPFLYLNIESCAVHWRLSQLLRAVLLKRWQPLEHARADVGHSGSQAAILRQLQLHSTCHQLWSPPLLLQHATPHPSESHPPEPQAPAEAPTEEADQSA